MSLNTDNVHIKKFREILRAFEREVFLQSNSSCCNGVTLAQCHTIIELGERKTESVGELAKAMGLDKSTVSRTVDALVNIGLVDRNIPQENRRTTTLKLTRQGKKICHSINESSDSYFTGILSVLGEEEIGQFISLFGKITQRMVSMRTENA